MAGGCRVHHLVQCGQDLSPGVSSRPVPTRTVATSVQNSRSAPIVCGPSPSTSDVMRSTAPVPAAPEGFDHGAIQVEGPPVEVDGPVGDGVDQVRGVADPALTDAVPTPCWSGRAARGSSRFPTLGHSQTTRPAASMALGAASSQQQEVGHHDGLPDVPARDPSRRERGTQPGPWCAWPVPIDSSKPSCAGHPAEHVSMSSRVADLGGHLCGAPWRCRRPRRTGPCLKQ